LKDDLELALVPGGTRVRLRVSPKAKKSAVLGVHGGALKLSVQAPPERGKANDAVVALLADTFKVEVTLVAGTTSKGKAVVIALPPAELCRRLAEILG
jgi:uncharacterized protein (TIGR00251 family)